MKTLISRLRILWPNRKKHDMFYRIRFRLTITYSAMLMICLFVFSVIAISILIIVVARDQIQEIQAQADLEAQAYRAHSNLPINDARFFSYVVSLNGQILAGEEVIRDLREPILNQLLNWKPKDNEFRLITLKVSHERSIKVLVAGRVIHDEGQPAAILYTGNNIIFYLHTFQMLLNVFLFLSVVFILIATYIGLIMSKRAMVPIVRSYIRQREFVADASHELRTPLSVLSSSLEVIELEEGKKFSPFSIGVLHDAKDEVRSMKRLVNDLLTLARSDSGELIILQETVELVSIANSIVRSIKPIAAARQIQLKLESPPMLKLRGDSEWLKQLIYILLDNAIKYTTADGEVILTLSQEQIERQTKCRIQVRDTGIGIPEDEQEHIFERFYRADKNRSRKMGGTGLGLAIAKWIVEQHKGKIEVKSAPGLGSTFTVWIPCNTVDPHQDV